LKLPEEGSVTSTQRILIFLRGTCLDRILWDLRGRKLIATSRKCKVSYHIEDSPIKEKGSKVYCSNCKYTFKVFPTKISRSVAKPMAMPATSCFSHVPAQKLEENTTVHSSYEETVGPLFETVSEGELNYIEENAATIISEREIYSWNVDSTDFLKKNLEQKAQINTQYCLGEGERIDRVESEIDLSEAFESELATEPFDALLELFGLGETEDSNLLKSDDKYDSESHFRDTCLNEDFSRSAGYDWREFEYKPDDFDEQISREEFTDVDTDGLMRSERAFQLAVELGDKYGCSKKGIKLLAEILEEYGWFATKKSLERELQNGMKPEDLEMASAIREIWKEYPEFSTALSYWGNHGDRSTPLSHRYLNLSWPAALSFVRCFDSYPDPAEIKNLFLELYHRWIANISFLPQFSSFYTYLRYHFGFVPGSLDIMPGLIFKEDMSLSSELYPDRNESQFLPSYLKNLNL